ILNLFEFVGRALVSQMVEPVIPLLDLVDWRAIDRGQCAKTVQQPIRSGRRVTDTEHDQQRPGRLGVKLGPDERLNIQQRFCIRRSPQQLCWLAEVSARVLETGQVTESKYPCRQ